MRYRCMGHSPTGSWTKDMGIGSVARPTATNAPATGPDGEKMPTLEEILWDVKTRAVLGVKPSWIFRFGLETDADNNPIACKANTTNSSLMRALIATSRTVFNDHKYNAAVVFRNASALKMPREAYSGAIVVYLKEGAGGSLRIGEGDAERKVEHATVLHIDASQSLSVTSDSEAAGVVLYSLRCEAEAPALTALGFPLRNDSHTPLPKGLPASGKLSDSELSSHGYERKMLKALTEKCTDFGPIYDFKQLSEVYETPGEVKRRVQARGWEASKVNHAVNVSERYEVQEGLLYRLEFDARIGAITYAWCVPKGSVRSTRIVGGRHAVSVRAELITWFHSSTVFGRHSAVDATYAKLCTRYYWPTLLDDVVRFIQECIECKKLRGRPLVSPTIRSDLYESPFVCIFFDHVGPLRPSSPEGNRYLLTAGCGFSSWGWAIPVPDVTAETTATVLVTRVFCDVGGFPVFVRHDRSKSFLNEVVKQINQLFGITALVGSAWRPQTQGPIENVHRKLGNSLRTLCEAHPDDWERRIPLAVWAWRVTPMPSLGGHSPYRIILGVEPRTPFSFASAPRGRKILDASEFVQDVADVYESTLRYVKDYRAKQRDEREDEQAKKSRVSELLVGDFVLVLRPEFVGDGKRPGAVSKKLMHRVFNEVYQVHHKLHGAAYVLKDAATGAEPTSFKNPINIGRLVRACMWQVREPLSPQLKRIEILQDDETTYRPGTIVGYGYGGAVRIKYDSVEGEDWIDLERESYRWLL